MASGPEHYLRAEQLLDEAAGLAAVDDGPSTMATLAAAQVHATLALAAATVAGTVGFDARGVVDWTDATAPTAVRS